MTTRDSRDDVLTQPGADDAHPARMWVRRFALVAVVCAALAVFAHDNLLSGDRRSAQPRPAPTTGASSVPEQETLPTVVARHGSRLVRYSDSGKRTLATLPAGFPAEERLWAVEPAGSRTLLYGVNRRELFRIDAQRGRVVRQLGTVIRIVDIGPGRGELLIEVPDGNGSKVVVINAATGDVTEANSFRGFDGTGNWTPRGVVTKFGVPGIVLTRPGAAGQQEVAVAWSERGVTSGFVASRLEPFGAQGRLIGVAEGWLLFLDDTCPSPSCALTVLSFTPKGAAVRKVSPPPGWSFLPRESGGQPYEVLVPVVRTGDGHAYALARVVAGGDRALLLANAVGLDPDAGVVAGRDGSSYFLLDDGDGRVVARWSPVHQPYLTKFHELPRLAPTARLVCACD